MPNKNGSEWPKLMGICGDPACETHQEAVISADLGQFLYEALVKAHSMTDELAAVVAIERYRREVLRNA